MGSEIQSFAAEPKLRAAVTSDLSRPEVSEILRRLTMSPGDVVEGAMTQIMKSTSLQSCSLPSIVESIRSATLIGCRLHPVFKEGYLIPYKNECTFMPSYIFLKRLAERSPAIRLAEATLIREGEQFRCRYTPQLDFFHEVSLSSLDSPILGAYARVVRENGEVSIEIMSISEAHKIRDSSEAYKRYLKKKKAGEWTEEPPWVRWEGEMIKKSVLKRLIKSAEIAPELAHAIALDDREYIDVTPSASACEAKLAKAIEATKPSAQPNMRWESILTHHLGKADKQWTDEFHEGAYFEKGFFDEYVRDHLFNDSIIQSKDEDLDSHLAAAKEVLTRALRSEFEERRRLKPTPATHEREPGEEG